MVGVEVDCLYFQDVLVQDASVQEQGSTVGVQHGEAAGCYGEVSGLISRIKIVHFVVVDLRLRNIY